MRAVAREKYVRMSPLKIRRILGLIKDKDVEEALNILHFSPKRASKVVEKALRSAVANFFQNEDAAKIPHHDIFIHNAYVDQGPTLRRFRPMSMGRVGRIRRRTSHVTIILEDRT
ncbi:50S ribosomal protein L22 [Candidatus Saccharibacteria bacterium]|nr:50S ribosomal protein L22 [Candidatus Saccharibacteria bacterium]NIV03728.1 50S ribosomal protein L22 [Calditrichia bacterium]NIV72029.1 50S ribosomal protein L22 [Calditrichia bacterium]NIV98862.1 50S ribosomal protein L22 [Candidatus Saccharibacteria bacterium]NIW79139.1 50S ribosomal protein L22 [Calditrichia bacterium]